MRMDTSKMKQVGTKAKVKDVQAIAAKHTRRMRNNTKLEDCCKDADEHDVEFFQTPDFDGPEGAADMMIMTCNCGRNHYVLGGGGPKAPKDQS